MARPPKYKPEYCEQLKQHMAQGGTFRGFAYKIGVGKRTAYDWVKKYPEFEHAKEIGWAAALGYFETLLLATIMGLDHKVPRLNQSRIKGLRFILATRFSSVYGRNPKEVARPPVASNTPFKGTETMLLHGFS